MNRIVVKKTFFGVQYHNDCPYCGLNTNLLSEEERAVIGEIKYCKRCYNEKINKKQIKPRDYYELSFSSDCFDNLDNEIVCFNLKRLEIAHLHGKSSEEDSMWLDVFFDTEKNNIYFRLCIVDDDDPWFGTETYTYLTCEQVPALLNKNSIHLLDGLNSENWKEYFVFENYGRWLEDAMIFQPPLRHN